MANAQVREQLIPHARGHYLAVAVYRYCVKTRKQGRDGELVYWKSCKSSLYRQRNTELPRQPATRQDIDLQGEWRETSGQNFVLSEDGDINKILVFGTSDNLRHLSQANTIFADGTFYASPVLFKQLYTIHALIEEEMYPSIFAFLPDKCQTTYQRLFTILKASGADNNTPINPNRIFMDFESAARNAAETAFPTANIKGCLFHFCQRIWKKVQTLGMTDMTEEYKNDPLLHQHVQRASALLLVPPRQVEDVWFYALNNYQTEDAHVTSINDYVTEQWVEREPERRNHFSTVGPTTTNHLEGWHHKLNNQLNKAHPNLFLIRQKLRNTQAATEIRLIQYAAGGKHKTRKLKYRNVDNKLT
ncbi:Hypothetical predicted protein [Mytilus galloprovincialis]|uniref:MULE transposase domain-containing protein n=1 Tax=Mytilus galloprovincialis TaxID=29158 RepID=A0A8B6BWK2_MYTGA|nr:Hypothetical predicted protein [Mytilus galloprovincialis]